jgi:alpha-amylase/alpha-mannosidase (GH57 family)
MTRFVCIHGHFYQPPRENPWLDAIEGQDSAAPFHDWNERITEECYEPNTKARVLDGKGRIDRLVNNYAKMSFNIGPTLMSWLEEQDEPVYKAILAADLDAIAKTGCGSAIAQVHGHLILPLCHPRDQHTQVRWGARDFERRFGRRPKGMWLSETACNTSSLEALAEEGIAFTILAPHQAARVRPSGGRGPWTDVKDGKVETRRAYNVNLPSGRSITVFFYDGPASRGVAFERLLDDGAGFANRLTGLFHPNAREPQIAHIATDGESYGHHHRFGEMGLAYALESLAKNPEVQVGSYELFLRDNPPTWDAEIVENTAWSCAHGIERWRSNCGCSSGAHATWQQAWRGPLRNALDHLRDRAATQFERDAGKLFIDPWAARNAYIDVVFSHSSHEALETFLQHTIRPEWKALGTPLRDQPWAEQALSWMELQRHAMSMYTSCGWFFDDLSGIETTQVLAYAARVLELAKNLTGQDWEDGFVRILSEGKSNIEGVGDGAKIWRELVKPRAVQLERAAAHFAVASLFNSYADEERLLAFEVVFEGREIRSSGRARLALGTLTLTTRATRTRARFEYAVVHVGDHHIGVGVRPPVDAAASLSMRENLRLAFTEADLTQLLRALEKHFPERTYSLRSLFKDEQQRILRLVLESTLAGVAQSYANIYEQQAPLMRYLAGLKQPVPQAFQYAAEFTLRERIREALTSERDIDLPLLAALFEEAEETGVTARDPSAPRASKALRDRALAASARARLASMIRMLASKGLDLEALAHARDVARFLVRAGLSVDHDAAQEEAVHLREQVKVQALTPEVRTALVELLETLDVAAQAT